ncbi:hypothetical protein, partial [Tateyamaria sp.]
PPQQHTEEMLGMEDTSRGLPRKDAGGDGQQPLPSEAIGVAVQVSLTVLRNAKSPADFGEAFVSLG